MDADHKNDKSPFTYSRVGMGALLVITILNLLFGPHPYLPSISSFATAAIVTILADIVIFLYKKIKSAKKSS